MSFDAVNDVLQLNVDSKTHSVYSRERKGIYVLYSLLKVMPQT